MGHFCDEVCGPLLWGVRGGGITVGMSWTLLLGDVGHYCEGKGRRVHYRNDVLNITSKKGGGGGVDISVEMC